MRSTDASESSVSPIAASIADSISAAEACRSFGRFDSARESSSHKRGSIRGSGSTAF